MHGAGKYTGKSPAGVGDATVSESKRILSSVLQTMRSGDPGNQNDSAAFWVELAGGNNSTQGHVETLAI
jgi:hypothetical protein